MSMFVDWDETHLIMGDSATLNITWNQNFSAQPYYQPASWLIIGGTASGGVNFFNTTIPAIQGDGATTTYTWTPTTWGWVAAGGQKKSNYRIIPLDGSGNSMGMIYGPGDLIHYTMPTITVTASPSTITSYGQNVTFTWSANGNLDKVDWDRGGSPYNPEDLFNLYGGIQSQPQSGTKTITQGGSGYNGGLSTTQTFVFTASHGFNAPYYVPNAINSRLTDFDTVTVNVAIASYGISAAKTQYTEGETMYCAVTTTNVAAGTMVFWAIDKITASLANGDFAPSPSYGEFQLDANGGNTWTVNINDDSLTEGSEMFRLKLYSDHAKTNELAQSSIITILASDQPSYGIGAAKSTYNEGETVYCAVTTSNVATGTTLYWKITGAGVNEQDFIGTLEGSGITNSNGQFTFSRTISNDQTSESTETFKLQLFTSGVGTNLVAESPLYSIIDTSQNISHSITPNLVSVTEGQQLEYTVLTTGYPPGSTMYWAMEGVGITGSDFSPTSISGSKTLDANGDFKVTRSVTQDLTTEGSELIYFRVMYPTSGVGDIVSTNTQVTILDTSTEPPTPAPTINFTASSTNINSGDLVVLTWNVTDSNNTTINQGIGSVPNSSTETVYPTQTTTYTLSASGPGGTNSATVTITVAIPPVLSVSGPSQIDWQESPIPINITASNSPGIVMYETYDAVVKPAVNIPNSTGTVNLVPYNYIPDWSNPVDIIQLHFTCGSSYQTLVISVGVDRTPDPITIPSTMSNPNEEVISPDVPVAVQDIDVPIEIRASQPIQVQVGGNTNWEDVREIQ